jgi:DNA-binding MarR family transcriptional regulator
MPIAGPVTDAPPPARVADLLKLSERVVLQLGRLGRIEPDAPVRAERTQQGLAEATSSNQSAVSKVLRRLVAAEILLEERRHIVGSSQRKKAYSLTRRGELLAREVARRQHVDLLPPKLGTVPTEVPGSRSSR